MNYHLKIISALFLPLLLSSCSTSEKPLSDWKICDGDPCSSWKEVEQSVYLKGSPAAYSLKTEIPQGSESISFIINYESIRIEDNTGFLYVKEEPQEKTDIHHILLKPETSALVISLRQKHFNPYNIIDYTFHGKSSLHHLLKQVSYLGFIGVFLAIIGAYSIILSLRSRRNDVFTFGAFAFFAGSNAFANSPLSSLLWIDDYQTILTTRIFSFYGGNLFLFLFMEKLLGKGPLQFLGRFNILLAVLSVLFLTASIIAPELNANLKYLYFPLTIAGGIMLLAWLFILSLRKNTEATIIFLGGIFLIFLQIGVYLNSLGFFPWLLSFDWAIFLFVLSLGMLLVRRSWLMGIHLKEIASELENKNRELIKSAEQKEKLIGIEMEMEMANKIQLSILPDQEPEVKNLKVARRYIPTESVGGDFFDFISNEDRLGILVTDVSGHGFSSALIASMVKITFHASKQYWENPDAMLDEISRLLEDNLKHNFLTACYVLIDPVHGKLRLANAGHPPLFLQKKNGDISAVNTPGSMIGLGVKTKFVTREVDIENGDRIILVTDGILDCENRNKEGYEEIRLGGFIKDSQDMNAEDFCSGLISHLENWAGSKNFTDDVTLVVVDVT